MRLIDADALDLALGQACDAKRQTPRGCLNRFDLKDALDAAPTVCCAECEYGPPPADAVGARTACVHCYCGDNFERRQP
jgi:hypothetical protein